jgi:hypothetical protein
VKVARVTGKAQSYNLFLAIPPLFPPLRPTFQQKPDSDSPVTFLNQVLILGSNDRVETPSYYLAILAVRTVHET